MFIEQASLRVIIYYNHNMFIVQATVLNIKDFQNKTYGSCYKPIMIIVMVLSDATIYSVTLESSITLLVASLTHI